MSRDADSAKPAPDAAATVYKSRLETVATIVACLCFGAALLTMGVSEGNPIYHTPFFGYGIGWLILAALEGIRVNMK